LSPTENAARLQSSLAERLPRYGFRLYTWRAVPPKVLASSSSSCKA
jgi:hypothetical protein